MLQVDYSRASPEWRWARAMPEFESQMTCRELPSCRLKSGQGSLRSETPGLSSDLEGQQGPSSQSSHLLVVLLMYLIMWLHTVCIVKQFGRGGAPLFHCFVSMYLHSDLASRGYLLLSLLWTSYTFLCLNKYSETRIEITVRLGILNAAKLLWLVRAADSK